MYYVRTVGYYWVQISLDGIYTLKFKAEHEVEFSAETRIAIYQIKI